MNKTNNQFILHARHCIAYLINILALVSDSPRRFDGVRKLRVMKVK